MISKPLSKIKLSDIEVLIEDRAMESKTLDFKQDFYKLDLKDQKAKDGEKIELLKDLSAFANAEGGDLIFGVNEDDGVICKITGFHCENSDKLFCRIKEIAGDWIEPRIHFEYQPIQVGDDPKSIVMVIRVEKSVNIPHRVTYNQHNQFYRRGFGSTSTMDTNELRGAFLASQSMSDRIREFSLDRFHQLSSDNSIPQPRKLHDSFLLVHIIPEQAYTSAKKLSSTDFQRVENEMSILGTIPENRRFNLDGFLISNSGATQQDAIQFTQFYKSGVIEMYSSGLCLHENHSSLGFVRKINDALLKQVVLCSQKNLEAIWNLDVRSTSWCFISMGMVGGAILFDQDDATGVMYQQIDRHYVSIAESMISSTPTQPHAREEIARQLRPSFDSIWNACGRERCTFYDEQGVFQM